MDADFLTPLAKFVLDHSVLPLVVLDGQAGVVQLNAAARSTGVDFATLFAKRAEDMTAFVHELRAHARAQLVLDDGTNGCWQLDGVSVDGFHVVRAREVGAERELHQELRTLRATSSLALVASASLRELADALTPVLILSSRLVDLLEKGSRPSSMAADIHSSATLAANLVRELLPLARPQPRSIECLDVNVAIRESRRFIERVLGGGNVAHFDPAGEGALVVVDRARLQHALLGLGALARDEMPHGGEVTFRTRVADEKGERYVVIEAAIHPRPTPEGASVHPPPSAGIDLASLQSFARESGGRVFVDRTPRVVVALWLPRCDTGEDGAARVLGDALCTT